MFPFDEIEKYITEHGSAAILQQQLAFAKDRFAEMELKVSELQNQVGRLEAQLERERSDHAVARQELQHLKSEHSEEVRISRMVEFRRGLRTDGEWMAFCPKCHLPARDDVLPSGEVVVYCSGSCGWRVRPELPLKSILADIEAKP